MWRRVLAVVLVAGVAGCGASDDEPSPSPTASPTTTAPPPGDAPPASPPTTDEATTTTGPTATAPPAAEIGLRLERRVDDGATADFADVVVSTLLDPRGWTRADFVFTFDDDAAPYRVVLAEGAEVDALCAPYRTGGRFSCQRGPVVALNADRWRTATPQWPADLDSYRRMLVNHEVGHLLGQHHPSGGCRTPGEPAPVMVQQSTSLAGCLANPWPLDWEIACAAARLEPLAPPYEVDPQPLCGPDGPPADG
jgi:hypothetical protein